MAESKAGNPSSRIGRVRPPPRVWRQVLGHHLSHVLQGAVSGGFPSQSPLCAAFKPTYAIRHFRLTLGSLAWPSDVQIPPSAPLPARPSIGSPAARTFFVQETGEQAIQEETGSPQTADTS